MELLSKYFNAAQEIIDKIGEEGVVEVTAEITGRNDAGCIITYPNDFVLLVKKFTNWENETRKQVENFIKDGEVITGMYLQHIYAGKSRFDINQYESR